MTDQYASQLISALNHIRTELVSLNNSIGTLVKLQIENSPPKPDPRRKT
jgi:hypothetical protein